jgi:hypothetical protein
MVKFDAGKGYLQSKRQVGKKLNTTPLKKVIWK